MTMKRCELTDQEADKLLAGFDYEEHVNVGSVFIGEHPEHGHTIIVTLRDYEGNDTGQFMLCDGVRFLEDGSASG